MNSTPLPAELAQSAVEFPDTVVFRGYGRPVRTEGDTFNLEVTGTIPAGLEGFYIRNSADHQFPPLNR